MSPHDAAILIVDDNGDNRYTLRRRLQREGYTDLEEAANGRRRSSASRRGRSTSCSWTS